ncbi:MAG: nucleotide exchange factor GrpE [Clostridiales bacterium]|nr:nucleotide exchange factor GrpE [Clostridiales bacterium]
MEAETKKTEPVEAEENAAAAEQEAAAQQPQQEPAKDAAKEPEQEPAKDAKPEAAAPAEPDPLEAAQKALADKEKEYLYLRAEYDNFRRRSAKEKSDAYSSAKADAALKFLPVYDNLERALTQGCQDEAFLKGIEMTMNQLKQVLESLDIKPIDAVGQTFDPKYHNAVMHIEDEKLGENVVSQCFQTGFVMGDKVIRFAMVQVAN